MRQYLVKVHCCGSRWLVRVPAIDRWTPVDDKRAIAPTAKAMIAAVAGVPVDSFDVDLHEDRVLGSIEEYTAGTTHRQRWPAVQV